MAAARQLFASRFTPGTRARMTRYLVLLAFVGIALFYALPRPKSFTISAVSEHLDIDTVSEGAPEWTILGLQVCFAGLSPDPRTRPVQDCDRNHYRTEIFDNEQTLRWTDDYQLEIRSFDDKFLFVYVNRRDGDQPVSLAGHMIKDGSILFIPLDGAERPILPLRGYITLGESPTRSDAMLLLSGSYEIRQALRKRSGIHVVASGDFVAGDSISLVRDGPPLLALPFLEQGARRESDRIVTRLFLSGLNTGQPGFGLVATTDLSYGNLLVTRVGGQPTEIAVSATQRLLADPIPVAVATLLGLMATIFALINNFFGKPGNRNNEPNS